MIKKIENFEFDENLKNNNYKYVFGKNQGEGKNSKYEIVFSEEIKIGIMSNGLSKPTCQDWGKMYVITINDEIFILDKSTIKLLHSYMLNISIYEAIPNNELLFVFGEIDILVINRKLEVIKQIQLDDILTDYNITNGKIIYTTSECENEKELIY